jgi:molybdate transport system regulatory protein
MKTARVRRPKTKRLTIRPRVKFWLELDGEWAFCPGVCRIMQEIDRTGSIKDAALVMGRSYRFVWGKIKQVERALGTPLVEARVGGSQVQRSVLSPMGRLLMQEFSVLRDSLFQTIDREYAPRLQAAVNRVRESGGQ